MLCKDAGPRLIDFDDGTLDDETAASLRRHLADCPDCRADLDTLRRWRGLATTSWRDERGSLLGVRHGSANVRGWSVGCPWRPASRPWRSRPWSTSSAGDRVPPVAREDPDVASDQPARLQPLQWFDEESCVTRGGGHANGARYAAARGDRGASGAPARRHRPAGHGHRGQHTLRHHPATGRSRGVWTALPSTL